MKNLIPLILLIAMPLHSSPIAEKLQLAGTVKMANSKYEVVMDAQFSAEKAHTVQYKGMAKLISQDKFLERPMTLYFTKKSTSRMIISILMDGDGAQEGLYLELVAPSEITSHTIGDLVNADAELMWVIRSPYSDLTETSFLTRDRGQAELEYTEVH
jgi:hypothetical protein